ncbi:putative nucleotidyltransferase with HDIG domain [Dyadobacter sp. BE34]|uniref:Nucleotidyltransferase with HDIG domain n=1 Tax=Dyadobacter fermentans TaxID=94254 RepID=A0ABU1R203_9BACT|nr:MULTISPECIES: HD domain-containing protein [Dyadobacter]MDR6807436.1 putative nucleotidyltransferase with HDIG domain [Dyadobacter fermentans]MDR7045177.1 putative nucleotidyltransferase with HDIG domain [Dyadobacter sp. BE242]MDR7199086.1 putative nucleotidyltransferase with HDIG domain [Dyadobacter sp. BE34]MDR7217046.1 putative nucleotidyltransferase with HDIG domain [Dyadobacter sp. BE31]MDR7264979.1 putative nucleotidyltransferase with HDIG domain [Dyadobacter sp. BE32]
MNFKEQLTPYPVLEKVAGAAKELGVEAYIIGGFVRDLILKRNSKDIDIVSIGSGIELAEMVASRLGPDVFVSVFKNFGTAQIRQGDLEIEFVGARKESYRSESRKPAVEDGTLADDQNRRDFTINAMGISLNAGTFGELVDPFEGMSDLRKKIIRTPLDPEITFSDDPLRMMRAIRFASQLNFDIEPDTFDAIVKMKERISIVSMERISDELNKIILSKTPSYGFKLLYHAGLLAIIFPELVELQGVEHIEGKGHKDNFYHTLQVLDNVCQVSDDLWLRWAAILHDIAKPATKKFDKRHGWSFHNHEEVGARMVPVIFRRMKLPLNEKMRFVKKLVRLHLRPIVLSKEEITDSAMRRLLVEAGEDIEALMNLCRADITSKNPEKVRRFISNFDLVEQKLKDLEERDKLRNFQPVITGEMIMEAFGLKPAKEVGVIKEAVREAILEGIVPNEYEPAFAFMIAEGEKMGLTRV